jgi:hypothetical protein
MRQCTAMRPTGESNLDAPRSLLRMGGAMNPIEQARLAFVVERPLEREADLLQYPLRSKIRDPRVRHKVRQAQMRPCHAQQRARNLRCQAPSPMVGKERIGELDLGLPFDDQMTNASATEKASDFIAQDPQSIAVALPVVQVRCKLVPGGRVRAEAPERRHHAPVAVHRAEFGQMIRPQAFSAYAGGLEMVQRPTCRIPSQQDAPARGSGKRRLDRGMLTSAMGLGCVETPTPSARVENLEAIARRGAETYCAQTDRCRVGELHFVHSSDA